MVNHQNDINIFKNETKITFLEERGYIIRNEVEISLRKFMSLFTLNPKSDPNKPIFKIEGALE